MVEAWTCLWPLFETYAFVSLPLKTGTTGSSDNVLVKSTM